MYEDNTVTIEVEYSARDGFWETLKKLGWYTDAYLNDIGMISYRLRKSEPWLYMIRPDEVRLPSRVPTTTVHFWLKS